MAFIQKHTSVISSDRTQLTIKSDNSEFDFINNGMSFPPNGYDNPILTITANLKDGTKVYTYSPADNLLPNFYTLGYIVNATDLTGFDYTAFEDDVYSVSLKNFLTATPTNITPLSETTNIVMTDSEEKYFENVLAYQRSQNYNPIANTRYDYLHLDSLYKSLKYAEQLNLIPSCIKLLNTFKKALL